MIAHSDRIIQISRNEKLRLTTSNAKLRWSGTDVPAVQEMEIIANPNKRVIQIQADSIGIGAMEISSSTGETWARTLLPGSNLFDFIVEPNPEEWYCENDTGNPPHPVSKGDQRCNFCGGRVLHGSQ